MAQTFTLANGKTATILFDWGNGVVQFSYVDDAGVIKIVRGERSFFEGDAQPRVTDNDAGEISVTFNGKELRGWSYANDSERRMKMLAAREYVEGWCDASELAWADRAVA